ncbi:MAG: lutB [Acidimicrobiaceae bacterium]|nr:lutB [Acidimicrobiaceae bacterium]
MSASFSSSPPFAEGARAALRNSQLRANLAHATSTIRAKRDRVIGELADFEQLRLAAEAVKDDALARLDELLVELERNVVAAGGHVHFARDAAEANAIVTGLVKATGQRDVVKVKSMTTAEIGLNEALAAEGIDAHETDLAELIVQLGNDLPSHIVVPAIHRNRAEIRETFLHEMGRHGVPAPADLSDAPADLAAAARSHLRERFLSAKVAISGANFAVAESGSLVVVESEGNGRMCLTLPETLISVVGIDKVIPSFRDLEIFLQLLPRSATGERMNPYTSIWTGPVPGDGPSDVHLVLLDNGRSKALADHVGRQALRCIRCAACLNVCPVYERVGGHAYGSVYPGPIGAVLTPQLDHVASDPVAASLPYASTLCGACFEVCPVRIDIPRLLVHLRGEVVDAKRATGPTPESAAMALAGYVLEDARRLGLAERLGARLARATFRSGRITRLPGPLGGWTDARDAPLPAAQSFRDWWLAEHDGLPSPAAGSAGAADSASGVSPRGSTAEARHETSSLGALVRALLPSSLLRSRGRAPSTRRDPSASERAASAGPLVSGRATVLGAIERALADDGPGRSHSGTDTSEQRVSAVERGYLVAGARTLESPIDLLSDRLEDYKATVSRVTPEGVGRAVAAALARGGARRVVVPADLPRSWLEGLEDGGVSVVADTPDLGPLDLDDVGAAVTGCAVAIAETGTIVLDGGAGQGRRIISLVPDHLVIVVPVSRVVPGVPDGVAVVAPTTPQTWISGPSATSDIELNRVEGVHGPRQLDVVLVDDLLPA